jgi:hypothetical protein
MPTTSRSMRQSCRVFVLTTSITCLPLGALFAQKAPAPPPAAKYDLQTEAKIKGTVLEIKAPEKEKDNLHMMLKSGEETVDVLLCPKSFLTEMGITFAKGDEVVVTGSKVKVEDTNMVLAREVKKGDDSLILRDDKGAPAWIWKH